MAERQSALEDADLRREQQAEIMEYMQTKAMASGDSTSKTKYIIVGILALLVTGVVILKL